LLALANCTAFLADCRTPAALEAYHLSSHQILNSNSNSDHDQNQNHIFFLLNIVGIQQPRDNSFAEQQQMALQQAAASNTGLSMEEALAKMRQDEEGRSSNIISVINDQVFRLIVSVQYSTV